jgi:hypothetical protein
MITGKNMEKSRKKSELNLRQYGYTEDFLPIQPSEKKWKDVSI